MLVILLLGQTELISLMHLSQFLFFYYNIFLNSKYPYGSIFHLYFYQGLLYFLCTWYICWNQIISSHMDINFSFVGCSLGLDELCCFISRFAKDGPLCQWTKETILCPLNSLVSMFPICSLLLQFSISSDFFQEHFSIIFLL